ncbi:MAG: glycosyltransferase family 4 protein [Flavobacterium sp.]|nr:glycosyltransferase family 4 protein [Flavobacterium sp.]
MKQFQKNKIIRVSTVAMSLNFLLHGQLAFLNEYYDIIGVSGQDKDLETVVKREKIRVVSVKMSRSISLLKDLKSLFQLYFLFRKEKPLIVHSITPKAGLLSMIAAKYAGVPIRLHTFTGLVFPSKKGLFQKLLILMDQLLCKCATHVYPEGEGVKNDLIHYKITSRPLKVLANGNINGIDTNFFSKEKVSFHDQNVLKKQLEIKTTDFVFIFVGRLVSDKGINELISAFSKLSKINRNCKMLLVGSMEEKLDPLQASTIREIELNENILSVGFQEDIRLYYSISNVLVFPSYREGFPNVVLQAGAMELPAIVTNINGCNEIIEHNVNGIQIPVKNIDFIFEAMKQILDDSILYEKLKMQTREIILKKFKQQFVWDAILKEYKQLENNV